MQIGSPLEPSHVAPFMQGLESHGLLFEIVLKSMPSKLHLPSSHFHTFILKLTLSLISGGSSAIGCEFALNFLKILCIVINHTKLEILIMIYLN